MVRRIDHAAVVAHLALFAALGGTSVAAITVRRARRHRPAGPGPAAGTGGGGRRLRRLCRGRGYDRGAGELVITSGTALIGDAPGTILRARPPASAAAPATG